MAGLGKTPESQAFQEFFAKLTKAIAYPEELAPSLYSEGLISQQTRDEVYLPAVESKKTSMLLGAVEKTLTPERMDAFIRVLRECAPLQEISRQLDQRVAEFGVQAVLDVLSDSEVGFSAANWRELGGRLKPDLDLDAIEAQYPKLGRRLEVVIVRWNHDGDDPSWETLADAVSKCKEGGGKNMAAKIRKKVGLVPGLGATAQSTALSESEFKQKSTPAFTSASSTETQTATSSRLAQKPTLPQLIHFKTKSGGTINIVQRIGANYQDLGILLLNDDDGSVAGQIISQFQLDGYRITHEVLRRWIQGQGKQPVTWTTLLGVLKSIKLSVLAYEIEQSL